MTSGEKAKHLTESLGQRDNDLFQQLGVSTEAKKERKVRKKADDSVNTCKRYTENVINHLRRVAKTKARSKH